MSRETYDAYLKRPGTNVSPVAASAFADHVRTCSICRESPYAYTGCNEGRRLAREATKRAIGT